MKKRYLQWYLLAVMCTVMVTVFAGRSFAQTWTGRQTTINSNIGGYYEYLPVGYDGAKKYPIIIFLHGYGELGNGKSQLNRLTTVGLPLLISNGGFPSSVNVGGQNYSFIVIAPQFINWPSANDVDNMITYALSNYSVDQSRIYLTGLSMGGGGTWDHAGSSVARASRLAAILPICGASTPNVPAQQNIATAKLPVLATHNMDDGVVTVNNTIGYVDGINSLGANPAAIKVLWPTVGHNAWTGTYDPTLKFVNGTMNVYEWMLQYTRSVSPPPPAPLVATISSNTPVRCNSQANGSAAVTAAGGVSPYTYSWNSSPAQTSATATGLAAGNYTVTVRDAMGTSTSASVTISQPAPLSITATAGTISTFGGTTSVTLAAAGGTAPYTFSGPTTSISVGTYNYTVTDSKGCVDAKTLSITGASPSSPLNIVSLSHNDVTCAGLSNGRASVSVTGGKPPYAYAWTTSTPQASASATNLAAGNYTVTVRDADGQTISSTVTIKTPSPITLQATANTIKKIGGTTDVQLAANGGSAPYAYTGNVSGLKAGTYSFQVKDANGCSTSASVDVKEPSVALSGFTLATLNNTIQVKWATSNEFAIARFEIEKAKDDKTFSGVGNYLALGAANSATSYNSVDGNDVEGNNLYKLFAVTSFGEKVYLGEKKLFFDNRGSVSIKNLTRRIDITVNSNRQEQINVVVYDILGRPVTQIVENKQNNTLRITIAMDTYKNGVYVVKVTGASGMQSVKQIVKQ
jgi:poly(3-hydroxybutyrate) depolymerase